MNKKRQKTPFYGNILAFYVCLPSTFDNYLNAVLDIKYVDNQ